MRKLIDIPDSIVKDLKILAVKNDKDLKNYIQDLISRHYEFSNMTEMASYAIDDGQSARFIWNYLMETYEGIKDETFDYGMVKYESLTDFLHHVMDVSHHVVKMIEIDEEEERQDIEDEKKLL